MPACCGAKVSKRPELRISELFYSIQGEGALVGVPSVFVRTSGCNLRCRWCDTPYTSWQPEGTEWPLDRILDFSCAAGAMNCTAAGARGGIKPVAAIEKLMATCARYQTAQEFSLMTEE